jgi:hypothetical protein
MGSKELYEKTLSAAGSDNKQFMGALNEDSRHKFSRVEKIDDLIKELEMTNSVTKLSSSKNALGSRDSSICGPNGNPTILISGGSAK